MRIIKLSNKDEDCENEHKMENFFKNKLLNRELKGKFLVTKGRISEKGLFTGEKLIFVYQGQIKYTAIADSCLLKNIDIEADKYPNYFCIDVNTLKKASGLLSEFEQNIKTTKNIAKTQGWSTIVETTQVSKEWKNLNL